MIPVPYYIWYFIYIPGIYFLYWYIFILRQMGKNVKTPHFTHQIHVALGYCQYLTHYYTALPLRPSISSIRAASGLFLGTMELLASASRWFAPKTVDLSVRFSHSHFVLFLFVNERSGRRKPPAEQSAL